MSAIGPKQRLLPALIWSRLGAKQTPLQVARMKRLTRSGDREASVISTMCVRASGVRKLALAIKMHRASKHRGVLCTSGRLQNSDLTGHR